MISVHFENSARNLETLEMHCAEEGVIIRVDSGHTFQAVSLAAAAAGNQSVVKNDNSNDNHASNRRRPYRATRQDVAKEMERN